MDHIRTAIEKTKVENAQPSRQRRTLGVGHTSQRGVVKPISYKQTKVVRLKRRHLEKNRVIAFDKTDSRAMAFDMLRTQVMQKMQEGGWKTLAVTSPTPSCGKTLTAINLSLSLAQMMSHTVLLADLDLRRPGVGSTLGLPTGLPLTDVLSGKAQLSDLLVHPSIPRLVVLPNGTRVTRSSEVLASPNMARLISDLKQRYESRLIIFDLPPVLTTDDTLTILPQIDCALLVVANGQSTQTDVEEARRLLSGTNLLGAVLNKSDTSTAQLLLSAAWGLQQQPVSAELFSKFNRIAAVLKDDRQL